MSESEKLPVPDIGVRLAAAAESVRGSAGSHRADVAIRDRLIVEACDAGWSWAEVARWAGLSQARIQQVIVARAGVSS